MDLKTAVDGAVHILEGATFEEEDGVFYLSIPTGDEDDDEAEPVPVAIYAGEDGQTILVRSEVGPYAEEIDLAEILRWLDSAIFARVYIGGGEEDEEGEQLVVEAGALLRQLDADLLAQMAQEVADLADEIADALYGEPDEADED